MARLIAVPNRTVLLIEVSDPMPQKTSSNVRYPSGVAWKEAYNFAGKQSLKIYGNVGFNGATNLALFEVRAQA